MIELMLQAFILAGSLILLAASSHFAIKSIEKTIEFTGLSEASAGFVILAVLTSTPEIVVALFSVMSGTPGVSVGDVLGSNIFNIGLVMGIFGTLGYMRNCCTELWVELTDMLLLSSLIPLFLVVSHYGIVEIPSRIVGGILLGIFLVAIFLMLRHRTPIVSLEASKAVPKGSLVFTIASLIISFIGVIIAARFTVSSTASIAVFLGVPPIFVGAKLVSIGTSLPELTLDFAAVRRGRVQLAVGGIIGSNVTNLTLVLGLVLISSPFAVEMTIFAEILPFLLITTIIFLRYLTRGEISQVGGILLIMTYILFQALIT